MKHKIRIKKTPQYAQGGSLQTGDQSGFGLYTTGKPSDDMPSERYGVNRTIQEADPEEANVIAERGETVLTDADGDGQLEHFNIGGERHEQGGTPLALKPGDFIFSDRKKMALKGEIVKHFGKTDTKKAFTPAQLAKQYDINRYKKILADPASDHFQKQTAERMIQNYTQKLGDLATVQEATKGNPAPQFAQAAEQEPEMAYGGHVPLANFGLEYDIDPYKESRTKQGGITPMGEKNKYNRGPEYLQKWEGIIPGISAMDNGSAQSAIYDYMLSTDEGQQRIGAMWKKYGLTNEGKKHADLMKITGGTGRFLPNQGFSGSDLKNLKKAYVDKMFGARQLDPFEEPEIFELPKRERVKFEVPRREPWKPTFPTAVPYRKPIAPTTPQTPPEIPKDKPKDKPVLDDPMNWWTQDKINMGAAVANRYNIKKYLPWEPTFNPVVSDPTFLDPTRQLNANAEQANMQTMATAMLGDPNRQRAIGSQIQGQSAGNAANILGNYDNQNVGIANQFEQGRAATLNQANLQNLSAKKRVFDGSVIANDQFDKEKKMASDVMRKTLINGMTNAQKSYWNNKTSEQYMIDPVTGRMTFKKARPFDMNGKGASGTTADPLSLMEKLKADYPGVSENILWERAKALTGQGRTTQTDTNGDGIADQNRFQGQGVNQLLSMMGINF
jgi:hypothetical protein